MAAAMGLLCVLTVSTAWSRPTLEVRYEHATFSILASANRPELTPETVDHHRTLVRSPTQRAVTDTCVPRAHEDHYTVCFANRSTAISKEIAEAIGTFAREHAHATFTIEADETAVATDPRGLARIRAQAIQAALVRAGISADDIQTKTRGGTECPQRCLDRARIQAVPPK